MLQRPPTAAVAVPMPTNRFPRTARVRARSDFDRIFKHGRRVALPALALHWQTADAAAQSCARANEELARTRPKSRLHFERPDAGPRLGLAVSRKVDPRAVGRNRIKRVMRETFRTHRAYLADGDYVVVARSGAAKLDEAQLRAALLSLLQRAGALPPEAAVPAAGEGSSLPAPATAGTMPRLRPCDAPASITPTSPAGDG